MKRRAPHLVALSLLAIAGITTATAATLSTASEAHTATTTHQIRLVEVERISAQLDLGRRGFSPGDRQTIASDLYTPSGHLAGRLDDDCAITQTGSRPQAICSFVLTLPDGQLSGSFAQNLASSDSGKRQAITGGTGRYADARGEIRVTREGKRTPFTIYLR